MAAPTELAVMMALRVRGRADAPQVARATGCREVEAAAVLAELRTRGVVAPLATAGPTGVVILTEEGRTALVRGLAAESIDRVALAAIYERFLVVDRELKQAVTAWQLAATADKAAAQASVMAIAAAAGGVATGLAEVVGRLAPYPARLASAAGAIATGDARFVASPRVDSLHQVWFELHEDLLLTLGRSRTP